MEKKEIKEILNQKYDRENWKSLAKNIFNNVEYFKTPISIKTDNKKILDFVQIGNLKLKDKKKLALFELKLIKNLNIYKNKVELRNIVTKFIDQFSNHGVLVVFDNQGSDYRLTFSSKYSELDEQGNIIETETATKRYTYLLGENESCSTPAERLHLLSQHEGNIKINDVLEAFNVDKITDEFFKIYKELYFEFVDELEILRKKNNNINKTFKNNNITNEEFGKKFLGQVIFIYFLQKKGWLGIKKSSEGKFDDWSNGDKNFLRNLFNKKYCSYNNFFNDIIEPFFIALKTNLPENYYSKLDIKIPFIGGELFEPVKNYDWLGTEIKISNFLIKKILDNFEMFNFTIQEEDPDDREVAIDPEMLGRVFENLLSIKDRKSKGTFYTPRKIVKFICENVLREYLFYKLEKFEISYQDVDKLIYGKNEHIENKFIRKNFDKIDIALKEIKICDPAIGSGEFPVDLMNIIANLRMKFNFFYKKNRSRYSFKLNFIEKSLFGNDIEISATETAKLRLWLSLVLEIDDYKLLKPLPNLDFKIINGDTLLSVKKDLFNKDILKEIEKNKIEYFSEIDYKKSKSYRNRLKELFEKIFINENNFDYDINFSEVIDAGGFDVIISNPPYVPIQRFAKTAYQKKLKRESYKTYDSSGDLYCLFYERSLNLLKKNGVLGFITSNKWLKNKYAFEFRKLLKNNVEMKRFVNFKGKKIFKSAAVDTCVLILQNKKPEKNKLAYAENIDSTFLSYNQSDLDETRFSFYNSIQLKLKKRIEKSYLPLGKFNVSIKGGIKTGFNKAFIVDEKTKLRLSNENKIYNKILVEVLSGKELSAWKKDWSKFWLINSHNGNARRAVAPIKVKKDYPKIYEILKRYKNELENRQDQGVHWTNLRDCEYFDKFNEEKILWSDISLKPSFVYDKEKYYVLNNGYVMFGEKKLLKYLIGILNSSVFRYLFEKFYSGGELGEKGFRYIKEFISKVPIPENSTYKKKVIELVDEITRKNISDKDIQSISKKIEQIILKIYEFDKDEIRLLYN